MKKIFSLFAAVLFVGSMFATEVTFTKEDFAGQGTANTGSEVSATKGGVTFTFSKGYCADESLRCYAHGALSITATSTIEKINFTTTGGKSGGLDPEVTVNATKYEVADLASQARFTEIKVTLGEGGGEGGDEESQYEDDENADFNIAFASYTIDADNLADDGDVYVEAQDANNNYIVLDIMVPEDAEGLVAGTYPVDATETYPSYQTCVAGIYDEGIYPSYAAVLASDGENLEKVWYIVSGTVVVDADLNITVTAKNSLGKDVKATLAGPKGTAVEKTGVAAKAVKTLENGIIVIEGNGIRHNVLGQIVR